MHFRGMYWLIFEPKLKEERAREQLRNLSQTGLVHTYVYRFMTLRADVPSMNTAETFSLFMHGLQPQLKQFVGRWWKLMT